MLLYFNNYIEITLKLKWRILTVESVCVIYSDESYLNNNL